MKNLNHLSDMLSSISSIHKQWTNILPENPLIELSRQNFIPNEILNFNTQILNLSQNYSLMSTLMKQFSQEQKVSYPSAVKFWNSPTIELTKQINSVVNSHAYKSVIDSYKTLHSFAGTFELIKDIQNNTSFLSKINDVSLRKYFSDSINLYTQIASQNRKPQETSEELNKVLAIFPSDDFEQITVEALQKINSKLDKSSSLDFRFFLISIIITILLSFYTSELKEMASEVLFKTNNKESKEFNKMLKVLCLQERVAVTKSFLKGKPSTQSESICSIEQGQKVVVQQINHKWVYITYQDSNFLVRSGWAPKKHFNILK